jgi:hypothetical protein
MPKRGDPHFNARFFDDVHLDGLAVDTNFAS